MNHWWRAYNEAVNDPKLQLISDSLFRTWFNLMCIASSNEGALPAIASLAFTLRMKPEKVAQALTQLCAAGLLDKTETGFTPHNWNGRQYKSDASDATAAERMRRHRESKRNNRNDAVTSTVTVTPPRADTEQNRTEAEKTVAPLPRADDKFEEFWKELPRRDGPNPRMPAEKKFHALVKTGVDPDTIIAGARAASADARKRNEYGTKFVPQAITWLNQQRFVDYAAVAFIESQPVAGFYAKEGSEQLDAWDAHHLETAGKRLPRDRNQGWRVSSEWPPGYKPMENGHTPASREHPECPA